MNEKERWNKSGLIGQGIDAHYDITAYTDHSHGPVIATVHVSHVTEVARRTASERADLICQAPELKQQIASAIAAAVQAEREANLAIVAELLEQARQKREIERARMDVYHRDCQITVLQLTAAAIRARSNGAGRE